MTHRKIIHRLTTNKFKAFTVGGCVRDKILGIESDDIDIVTEARPEQVIALFRDKKIAEVGKSFGVVLVDDIEVATFRHDVYTDNDLTVKYADTIEEDLSRRDITINAMAYCESTGEVIDLHNGRDDLKNRIVRFVGNPIERIKEDPCRILRACRFLSKIHGQFDAKTLRGLRWGVQTDRIKEIAPERIRIEILKAMKVKNASTFFGALHTIGALKLILPSLNSCFGHEHGNHHVENVWEHCMIAGDAISTKYPLLKLAGYLHDCGKPKAFNPETKQFLRHEFEGAYAANEELAILKFSNEEIEKVHGIISCHMYAVQKMSLKATRKFVKRLDEKGI